MLYDVIVIGAGPAGISASNYCNRLGLNTLLLYDKFGGQVNYCDIIYSIPSSPCISAQNLLDNYHKTIENIETRKTTVSKVEHNGEYFNILTNNGAFISKTLIACTGAKPKPLPEIILNNVSIPILNYEDYPFSKLDNLEVAVIIGGGYVGLEIAYQLSDKIKDIYIVEICRQLGANKQRQKTVQNLKNIHFMLEAKVKAISGRDIVILTTNGQITISADCIFSAYGIKPNIEIFNKLYTIDAKGIEIYRSGYPEHINMSKQCNGFFAAGDVVDLPINGFVSFAEGMGIETAKAVYFYLNKQWKN